MFSREIICASCLHKGRVEIGTPYASSVSTIFKYVGHDPLNGTLHFRCPACGTRLAAKPMKLLNSESIMGSPLPDDPAPPSARRHIALPPTKWLIFIGTFLCLILLCILIYFL